MLFGLSIYIFREKFMPGKIYVIATVVFFTLATVSLSFDLAFRFNAPMAGLSFLDQPTASLPGFESFQNEGSSLQSQNIQSVSSYAFFITGYVCKKKIAVWKYTEIYF